MSPAPRESRSAASSAPSAAGTESGPESGSAARPSATDTDPGAGIAPEGHDNLFVLVPIPADPSLGHGGVDGAGAPVIEADAPIETLLADIARGIPGFEVRPGRRRGGSLPAQAVLSVLDGAPS